MASVIHGPAAFISSPWVHSPISPAWRAKTRPDFRIRVAKRRFLVYDNIRWFHASAPTRLAGAARLNRYD
jgi:hypothetical protein